VSHDRQAFELAWSNRPWIAEDESDKDRAWRWWVAALESAQPRLSSPQEQKQIFFGWDLGSEPAIDQSQCVFPRCSCEIKCDTIYRYEGRK
jgi:hypothetical protein